jgi:hypothetical protein
MPRLSKIGAAALAAFGWTSGGGVTASVLVVAGGGGGGADSTYGGGGWKGGAGGAGGYLEQSNRVLSPTVTYTITVGGGGSAGASAGASGGAGSNSVFDTSTALGGGAGAGSNGTTVANGNSGGSGGGAAGGLNGVPVGGSTGTGGSATQGNSGGATGYGNAGGTSGYATAGGGGGAGGAGSNQVSSAGGGAGRASSISGSSVTYAAGGAVAGGVAGTTSTGNGGSGGSGNGAVGYAGGSGIVIISYAGAQQFGGGVVTSVGGNTIHTFNTSGTLVPITTLSASYLIVAGGAGGGSSLWASTTNGAGGGGAGGLLSGSSLTIDPNSTYLVTVGAGGAGSTAVNVNGSSGTSSTFSMVSTTAVGGGGGGSQVNSGGVMGSGQAGGSGGGGCGAQVGNTAGGAGTGTSGQGNNGGAGLSQDPNRPAGGGGGSGGAGVAGSGSNGGNGGVATASSISGTSTYYAGGGGGGVVSGTAGLGGGTSTTANKGGAGDGAVATASGGTATANTGGGGGGAAGAGTGNGGNGGSGVVIISYPGATQLMAGGTVTISGGNVIHTFTSSGYLTPIKYVGNSLRFRSSASAYLNRTFKTPTSQQKGTFSFWLKRGALGARNNLFSNDNGTQYGFLEFDANNKLNFADPYSAGACSLVTTQVFRDPAAWYHIQIAFDTTQATSTDRAKFYVNGVQITSFDTATYPSQNANLYMLQAGSAVQIAAFTRNGTPTLDGYLTEFNFIDGQALTPNSFGTRNSYGVWQPITYGGSYGINGFYLPFTNTTSTTTLGYDFSPNGNNWTTNNISLTAGVTYDSMTDVPTLTSATAANYPTFNAVNSNATLSRANLQSLSPTASWVDGISTMAFPVGVGKWYVEATNTSNSNECIFGVTNTTLQAGSTDNYRCAYSSGGLVVRNGYSQGDTTGLATYTTNDVIGMAVDCAAGTVAFYKNNTLINTTTAADFIVKELIAYTRQNNAGFNINFGQRPFSYTPPSGFVALNTFNL